MASITIPSSVTRIENGVFDSCTGLTSIVIGNGVAGIGKDVFNGCSALVSITIPNSVTGIGNGAFYGCSSLTSVTIPSSVTSIGDNAFFFCSGLTSIYVKATTPPTVSDNAFEGVDYSVTLYVPKGTKAAYEAAEGWSNFINIVEIDYIKYNLTVSSAGYATMYLDVPVAAPAGVKVYTASHIEDIYLQLEEVIGLIPANTGVIIKAEPGTYNFEYTTDEAQAVEKNLLKGTVSDTYITPSVNKKYYVLSMVDGVIGMYIPKLNGNGAFLNNANKAYMELQLLSVDGDETIDTGNGNSGSGQLSNGYRFRFPGTTAVESVVTEGNTAAPVYYDLSGRRVENPIRGLYIVNGKKVYIK